MKPHLILIVIGCLSTPTLAQQVIRTHQPWADITLWYPIGDKTKIGGDFGYRTTTDALNFHLWYIRPTIQWKGAEWYQLSLAFSNFHIINSSDINLNEIRLAQEAMIIWPRFKYIKFDQRFRFEERFYSINNSKQDETRFRYRIAASSSQFHIFELEHFYTGLTWEAFHVLAQSKSNPLGTLHRWEVILGNQISEKLRISFHYIWQTSLTESESFELSQNIFRLRLIYTLK